MWYDEKPQSNFPCKQEELGNAITYATNNQQAEQQSLDPIEMLALMNSKRSLGVHHGHLPHEDNQDGDPERVQ